MRLDNLSSMLRKIQGINHKKTAQVEESEKQNDS